MENFWNPMQESISRLGQWTNAPVIFDWNTEAAREDVRNSNNPERSWNSAAGQSMLPSQPANDNFVHTAANSQAAPNSELAGVTQIASGGYDVNGNYLTGAGSTAAQQQAKAVEDARRQAQITQDGYRTSGNQSVTDTTNKYSSDVNSFIGTLEGSQNEINTGLTNNALGLRRSVSNIAGGIRTGLKSGGVQLANMNATDSGASDAMARAYATMGNQQFGDASNEAALKENELTASQATLNTRRDEKIGEFDAFKEAEVSRIRGDLSTKLQQLDLEANQAGASGVVDMGIVDAIVNDAVARFQGINDTRTQRLGQIQGLDKNQVNQRAAEMDQAGMQGTSPFAAGAEGIALNAGGQPGAAISQLPFYARPKEEQMARPIEDEQLQRQF